MRKSTSLSCHARLGLSLASLTQTAPFTLATLSSTLSTPPRIDSTSLIPAQMTASCSFTRYTRSYSTQTLDQILQHTPPPQPSQNRECIHQRATKVAIGVGWNDDLVSVVATGQPNAIGLTVASSSVAFRWNSGSAVLSISGDSGKFAPSPEARPRLGLQT